MSNWRNLVELTGDDTRQLFSELVRSIGWMREKFRLTQRRLELRRVDVTELPPAVLDVWLRTAGGDVRYDQAVIRHQTGVVNVDTGHMSADRRRQNVQQVVTASRRVVELSGRVHRALLPDQRRGASYQHQDSSGRRIELCCHHILHRVTR